MTGNIPTRHAAINRIRGVAYVRGYAIGVHGSSVGDVYLIAAPWVPDAESAACLAEAAALALHGVVHRRDVERAHGRLCFTIYLRRAEPPDHWCVKLSVLPRRGDDARRLAGVADELRSRIAGLLGRHTTTADDGGVW